MRLLIAQIVTAITLSSYIGPDASNAAYAQSSVQADVLFRLASSLEDGDELVVTDFAAVALSEMIIAYELEFEHLSSPGQVSRRERAKQARWSVSLQAYLDNLYAARDQLDAGEAVQVAVSPPTAVQLLIGDRALIVSSPRIGRPGALREQIVRAYCESFLCDPAIVDATSLHAQELVRTGGWSFSPGMGSTFQAGEGLGFMFSDVRYRSRKEQLCRQIFDELERLAQALGNARRRGQEVNIHLLRVRDAGVGDDQRVMISASGEGLRLHLPTLAQVPDLLEIARSWLVARSRGQSYQQLFPRAEILLSKLLKS